MLLMLTMTQETGMCEQSASVFRLVLSISERQTFSESTSVTRKHAAPANGADPCVFDVETV